jgi:hypothetical protein
VSVTAVTVPCAAVPSPPMLAVATGIVVQPPTENATDGALV